MDYPGLNQLLGLKGCPSLSYVLLNAIDRFERLIRQIVTPRVRLQRVGADLLKPGLNHAPSGPHGVTSLRNCRSVSCFQMAVWLRSD